MAQQLQTAGLLPTRVTIPVEANTMIERGQIVQQNANQRGIPGTASNGLPALGLAMSTIDNRTGGPFGGAAGAVEIEVDCGVVAVDYVGTVKPTNVVYVSGAQQVTDVKSTHGAAGVCHEVRDGKAWVWMNPCISGLLNELLTALPS